MLEIGWARSQRAVVIPLGELLGSSQVIVQLCRRPVREKVGTEDGFRRNPCRLLFCYVQSISYGLRPWDSGNLSNTEIEIYFKSIRLEITFYILLWHRYESFQRLLYLTIENNNPSSLLLHFCFIYSGSNLGSWISSSPHLVVQSFHLLQKHSFSPVRVLPVSFQNRNSWIVFMASGNFSVMGCWMRLDLKISEGFADQTMENCPGIKDLMEFFKNGYIER